MGPQPALRESGEAPDELVWLFYVVRFGETWSTSRVQVKVSRDSALTWSDASVLSLDEGTMVRNRPIVLKNGDYLLPVYHETGHDPERQAFVRSGAGHQCRRQLVKSARSSHTFKGW